MTQYFSDNFAATLSATNWSQVQQSWATTSGVLRTTSGVGALGFCRTTTSAHAAIANCRVKHLRVGAAGAAWDGGPISRSSGGSGSVTCYMADFFNNNTIELYRYNAGTFSLLASSTSIAHTANDELALDTSGTGATVSLRCLVNSVSVLTFDDTNGSRITAAGQTGVCSFATTNTDYDDFSVEDIPSLDQEGFRFRNDDGSETTATWVDTQDTNITRALSVNTRLRVLLNGTGDYPSTQFRLEYKKSSDSVYVPVLLTAPGAPNFQAAGTGVGGTGNISPAWPTHQKDDIALLIIESNGGQAAALGTAAGFAAVTNSPVESSNTVGTRLTVYWCRATSAAMGAPTVTDPGDHAFGVIVTFRGCIAEGNPWDTTVSAFKTSSDTVGSAPGVTTTVPNALVVNLISRDSDISTASFGAPTNASLSSLAEQYDLGTTQGNGGGLCVQTGVKAAAGAVSATTSTLTAAATTASLTVALRPQTTPVIMSASSNITASGQATTAQLTAPSGKTTSDFVTGRMQDDENPADAVNITTDDYTELEWCVMFQSPAVATDVYTFRVTANGTAIDTYTVTPQVTIGSGTDDNPVSWSAGEILTGSFGGVSAAAGSLTAGIGYGAAMSGLAATIASLAAALGLTASQAGQAGTLGALLAAVGLGEATGGIAGALAALTGGAGLGESIPGAAAALGVLAGPLEADETMSSGRALSGDMSTAISLGISTSGYAQTIAQLTAGLGLTLTPDATAAAIAALAAATSWAEQAVNAADANGNMTTQIALGLQIIGARNTFATLTEGLQQTVTLIGKADAIASIEAVMGASEGQETDIGGKLEAELIAAMSAAAVADAMGAFSAALAAGETWAGRVEAMAALISAQNFGAAFLAEGQKTDEALLQATSEHAVTFNAAAEALALWTTSGSFMAALTCLAAAVGSVEAPSSYSAAFANLAVSSAIFAATAAFGATFSATSTGATLLPGEGLEVDPRQRSLTVIPRERSLRVDPRTRSVFA